jgi:hypothetical protein
VQAPTYRMEQNTFQNIDKSKHDALGQLSRVSVALLEAEGSLEQIKKQTETYIRDREKMTTARIEALLKESSDILTKIRENYAGIERFHKSVTDLSEKLASGHDKLTGMTETFLQFVDKHEEYVKNIEEGFKQQKRDIIIQQVKVDSGTAENKRRSAELSNWQTRLMNKEASLENALKVIRQKTYGSRTNQK